MQKLFSMVNDLEKNNINLILIQISEAHSTAWPLAIEHLLNVSKVEPQKSFDDRVNRANNFINNYNPPYKVYIDSWTNDYEQTFRAWPDKYYLIDNEYKICSKSEYHSDSEKEALVIEDCTLVLSKLLN